MASENQSAWTAGAPVTGIVHLKIGAEVARLKQSAQWAKGDRAAESLAKNGELSVTLMALKRGAALKEHHARGTVAVTVLAGAIRLNGADYAAGDVAVIDREIPHAVEALEESALLLTAALK
jgi:quercetin dioxygenase-like cupin family protein